MKLNDVQRDACIVLAHAILDSASDESADERLDALGALVNEGADDSSADHFVALLLAQAHAYADKLDIHQRFSNDYTLEGARSYVHATFAPWAQQAK